MADATGTTVWRWDQQEPFGVSMPDENPSGLGVFEFPVRFPGQYFDKETHLHYNYFRDCYDPATGRYCQSDPIGLRGGINTYAYVSGNSISYTDPSGQLGPLAAVGLVALAGGLAQGTASAVNGGSFVQGFGSGALTGAVIGLAIISGGSTIALSTGLVIETTGMRLVGGYFGGLLTEFGTHFIEVGHVLGSAHGAELNDQSKNQVCR